MSPILFLSHAGSDLKAAEALADRIEKSDVGHKKGVKVWLDKRSLEPGKPWMKQLEAAIETESTAFGLLLTQRGVRSWVESEVRVALNRVIDEGRRGKCYPFIPIFAEPGVNPMSLPAFARAYQGVTLGEGGTGLDSLLRAVLELPSSKPIRLVEEPFLGLDAFGSESAGLFFGRESETRDLVERVGRTNFVLVVGESGSGKSSLVKAGLVPAFRQGALADPLLTRPDAAMWHVVEMRPGSDPFEGLVDGISRADRSAGQDFERLEHASKRARSRQVTSIRDALRESAPPDAHVLLVVDQMEELWTQSSKDRQGEFLAALLDFAAPGDERRRVVGTMRRDYAPLCSDYPDLAARLEAGDRVSRFLLGRMTDKRLCDVIEKPLALAGVPADASEALAAAVLRDITDQPGDLALVAMALKESWDRRDKFGGDLLRAYGQIGRVEGALAFAAEEVFTNPGRLPKRILPEEEEDKIAEVLFVRLVRLGDMGGATRRVLRREEVSDKAWKVALKLSEPECRRLLVMGRASDASGADLTATGADAGAKSAEIAHERLVTSWPRYRDWLRQTPSDPHRNEDKRALDRLIDRAELWKRGGDLATGQDLATFADLAERKQSWLSPAEREFINASAAARDRALSLAACRSDLREIRALQKAAQTLFPTDQASESRAARLQAIARRAIEALPQRKAELEQLRAPPPSGSGSPSDAGDPIDEGARDDLTEFISEAVSAAEPERGALAVMGRRFARATAEDTTQLWANTIGQIANNEANPIYRGLVIRPLSSLYPLGKDPKSHLFEFAHLYSGSLPQRGADGCLVQAPDAAMVLVLIPGGKFWMGAEKEGQQNIDSDASSYEAPVHEVILSPFFLSKYECTQAQWERLTDGGRPSRFQGEDYGDTRRNPVERVSWDDCAGEAGELPRYGLRLPTEAQWEYACRAGKEGKWCFGNDEGRLGDYAWYEKNADARTHPVGDSKLKPNTWGFYDMHGNVWEWCADFYDEDYYGKAPPTEPPGPGAGSHRVLRGGSWNNDPWSARSACRGENDPTNRYGSIGFRVAASLPPSASVNLGH